MGNGNLPPDISNGKDWDTITFTDEKMGYILFFKLYQIFI